jgi:hypothetical protein
LHRDLRLLNCIEQMISNILQQKKISLYISDSTVVNEIHTLQTEGVEDQIQIINKQKDHYSSVNL